VLSDVSLYLFGEGSFQQWFTKNISAQPQLSNQLGILAWDGSVPKNGYKRFNCFIQLQQGT